jgi:enamine deaminase RidA (YjgF/YER057c/UK114 family)
LRRNIGGSSPYEPIVGFSRAVVVGDRVLVSGTAPIWPDDQQPEDHRDPYVQARRCLELIVGVLAQAGASPSDVVRTRTYLTDAADWEAVGRAHGEVFTAVRPASTMVVVAALLDPGWKVEMEAEALLGVSD